MIYIGMLAPVDVGPDPVPVPDDIDLLAVTLDPRITYTGPAHWYIAADGTLKQSAANEWPLEYAGGVVAGRHITFLLVANEIRKFSWLFYLT